MEEQPPQPITVERESATIIVNGADIASGSGSGSGSRPGAGPGSGAALADDRPGVSGVHLLLMCLDTERHVTFHEGVVDNEGMNRRKSKCCCIYRKPHDFGESSSSSDDECEHCCGHPEVRLRNRLKKQQKQNKLCHCKGHHCGQQAAPAQEEPTRATEVAGDSSSLSVKVDASSPQPKALIAASSKAP